MRDLEIYSLMHQLSQIASKAQAHDVLSERLQEAHDYLHSNDLLHKGWGKNVWHAILDDAISLRTELNNLKSALNVK